MLSELYRPKCWADFVGQPAIDEIQTACGDRWLFQGCGERWIMESDSLPGVGKTAAAHVAAMALGCDKWDIERIDSRAATIGDLRDLERRMYFLGRGPSGRRAYIMDEIQDLNTSCQKYLLGLLENLPKHVIFLATTTSLDWGNSIPGLLSRWRRFRFRKPDAKAVAAHLERIAAAESLPVPAGWSWLGYVQGKLAGVDSQGNNVRALIDLLPDALRRTAAKAA